MKVQIATKHNYQSAEAVETLYFLRRFLIALITLLSSGFGVVLISNSAFSGYAANRFSVVILGLLLIFSIARSKELPSKLPMSLLALIGFFAASVAWSANKELASLAAISLTVLWLTGWAISRLSKLIILRTVRNALTLGLLASLITSVFFHEIAYGQIERLGIGNLPLYRGLWSWNSEVAIAAGLVLIISLMLYGFEKIWISILNLVLAFYSLAISGSALTEISVLCFGFLFFIFSKNFRKFWLYAVGVLFSLALLAINFSPKIAENVPNLFGRDTTFSGRSVIWQLSLVEIGKSPIFGYGVGNSPDLSGSLGWTTHAHNGFLAALLELGGIGLLLICLVIKSSISSAWKNYQLNSVPLIWFIIFLNFGNDFLMSANVLVLILSIHTSFRASNSELYALDKI